MASTSSSSLELVPSEAPSPSAARACLASRRAAAAGRRSCRRWSSSRRLLCCGKSRHPSARPAPSVRSLPQSRAAPHLQACRIRGVDAQLHRLRRLVRRAAPVQQRQPLPLHVKPRRRRGAPGSGAAMPRAGAGAGGGAGGLESPNSGPTAQRCSPLRWGRAVAGQAAAMAAPLVERGAESSGV